MATSDKKGVKLPEMASSQEKSKKKHSPAKKLSTDAKLEAMNQKWSKHFSRLEAFLLSKSLEKPSPEPTFQIVKMSVNTPLASAVMVSEPFLAPMPADLPAVSTDQTPAEVQHDQPRAVELRQPTGQSSTKQIPAVSRQVPGIFLVYRPHRSVMLK